ncbi:MAG: phosphatase PAP2 family protein [Chitinophagales bacterium]
MNYKLVLIFLFLIFNLLLSAQNNSPYELNFKRETLLLGLGGVGSLTAVNLQQKNIAPLTIEQINAVNANDINGFDRSATRNWSTQAAKGSDYFLYASAALPFTLLIDKPIRNDAFIVGTMFVETVLINLALTDYTKYIARRYRPLVYNDESPLTSKQDLSAQLAFFSGHTSGSAALCFFTAKVLTDYHPNSKLKPLIWGTAAMIPAITGYLRYKAGKHYPTDVIVGYLVGASIGYLIPQWHRKKEGGTSLQFSPSLEYSGMNVLVKF